MNLLNKKWINLKKIKVDYTEKEMIIQNSQNTHVSLIFPKIFKNKLGMDLNVNFKGTTLDGNACTLKMVNKSRQIICNFNLNSYSSLNDSNYKYFLISLYIPAKSKVKITKLDIKFRQAKEFDYGSFHGDTLVVTPGYPTMDNKYLCAFVHTRVKAYLESNFNVDVCYISDMNSFSQYEFEGVKVTKANYYFLRTLLQKKKYDKILIHFFNEQYANVLESINLSNTKLYFFLHGSETLYRDWPKIVSPYFGEPAEINSELEKQFKVKDFYIHKYNNFTNAKWIFVTEWTKKRCEELLNIKFNNFDIIPCLIDTNLFSYQKKNPDLRKKIFILRKFDDINSYSIDTAVRIILELSRRDFFEDLVFDIYGSGSLHEELLEPIMNFKNVNIYDTFLTHKEIRAVHNSHGIALFPTRFDSQAVSSCEAASSGCAVITSDIPGVRQFIPTDLGVLCDTENYREYADVIEKMYYDSDYFLKVAKAESESVQNKFDYKHTIKKELTMYEKDNFTKNTIRYDIIKTPILSVIIPSYNVEQYISHTIYSILDQKNCGKIEIIVVNDGSKDSTGKIAEKLKKEYEHKGLPVIKVINKENGGHGSTINEGIKAAKGKYIKIIDGDDTVDSEEFSKLIDILEKEESDIVLNNYIEDFAITNTTNTKKIYTHLKPKIQYHFDDLCYDNYGFTSWGPILSCSSYKASMLKEGNFKLSEKMFYVDMELNINVAILCDTITYYDLDIYRYLLGRQNQSVTMASYKKNYKHHENVCINMINIYYDKKDKISENKKKYIVNKLILPMLSTQYEICINYMNDGIAFREYEKRLKKYPEFYNNSKVCIKKVKFHRKTKGYLIKINDLLVLIRSKFRRG